MPFTLPALCRLRVDSGFGLGEKNECEHVRPNKSWTNLRLAWRGWLCPTQNFSRVINANLNASHALARSEMTPSQKFSIHSESFYVLKTTFSHLFLLRTHDQTERFTVFVRDALVCIDMRNETTRLCRLDRRLRCILDQIRPIGSSSTCWK